MASVQDIVKCPKCGGILITDFDCRTTEEFRICLRCGYSQSWVLRRNEDGSVVTDENGKWCGDYFEQIGYGTLSLQSETGIGHIYNLTEPLSSEDKAKLTKSYESGEIESSSYAVLFTPETGTLTALFGTIPPDYDEEVV